MQQVTDREGRPDVIGHLSRVLACHAEVGLPCAGQEGARANGPGLVAAGKDFDDRLGGIGYMSLGQGRVHVLNGHAVHPDSFDKARPVWVGRIGHL